MKTNEEIVREYRRMFLLDTDEILDESLKIDSTPRFQLYCSRCSDSDEFEHWLRTTLEAKDKECEERVREEREKIVKIIKEELRNAPLEVQMSKGIIFANVIQRIAPTKTDKPTEV